MRFLIMAEKCNECLYGPNKIVNNSRRKEILKDLNKSDDFFICHKATIADKQVACRGDWDQRLCGQAGRIAGRLGVLEFVSEAELPTLPKRRKTDGCKQRSTKDRRGAEKRGA